MFVTKQDDASWRRELFWGRRGHWRGTAGGTDHLDLPASEVAAAT